MGHLSFISETGTPHSACLFEFVEHNRSKKNWWGVQPGETIDSGIFLDNQALDRRDRTNLIMNYVRFEVEDNVLSKLELTMQIEWVGASYFPGVQDCLSFTAWVAKRAGLEVPMVNMDPDKFIRRLTALNRPNEFNKRPFPWQSKK
jgi:hypothetical protein